MPDLSIITINLNNCTGLEKTMQSVFSQTYSSVEYIVIDGGSTDGSVDLLKINNEQIAYWNTAPDKGIYHAMNKGIRQATGEYCLFLNSGDWLVEPVTLANIFAKKPQADIVSGDIYFFDLQTNTIKWHVPSPDKFTAKTLFLGTLPHQATLLRRSLFDRFGMYNEQLKIVSDWLFFLEALLVHGCSYQHHAETIAYFNMDGISCDPQTASLPRREQLNILKQKYSLFLPDYEQLDRLEKQSQAWLQSREYRVYCFLEYIGVIQLGVFTRRLKRFVLRNLVNKRSH